MIIALLFLIFFAILFPKALRFLFALLFIGGIMIIGQAHAEPAMHKQTSLSRPAIDCSGPIMNLPMGCPIPHLNNGQPLSSVPIRTRAISTQCSLTVNSKVYINKICNVEFEKRGSFTMGAGQKTRNNYFVYMNQNDDGTMTGYWNAEGESHAGDPLGTLSKSGRCWSNQHAQVCAIPGE